MAGLHLTVVGVFQFCWWDISAVFVESAVVERVDPFGGGVLDLIDGAPGSTVFDHFGLVETVDRFGQGVVERIPNAANRYPPL